MDRFLTWVEVSTEKSLTKRKAKRAYNKAKKRTFLSETLEWIDALVFGVFWVIIFNQFLFQLFLIPSPSMVDTLLVQDRVVVFKDQYGVEVYPAGPKIAEDNRRVQRDDIITFYNPEYDSKGPVFDILSQAIYMGTLSLVNIDKNEDGTPAERLYVKRAAGLGGDNIYFKDGNVYIKAAGTGEWVDETEFRSENFLSDGPNRSVDQSLYPGLKAYARITAFDEAGIAFSSALLEDFKKVQNSDYSYIFDYYEYSREYNTAKACINPESLTQRSDLAVYRTGIYVPEDYVLPLGDNRDNSQDGRYFGPVSESKVNGRVVARFWPLGRIGLLTES
ncbi:MAG: signal peptidase I [Spirochaetales bacterium]|nr:signal peptidase I [Spirochaetales bacterium]